MTEKTWEWEVLDKHTDRMRVPGGWVLRSCSISVEALGARAIHQVFVPDPPETEIRAITMEDVMPSPDIPRPNPDIRAPVNRDKPTA